MKKKVLLIGLAVVALLSTVGCSKEKRCRCSVLHSTQVRIITIESGECEDLKLFVYHDAMDHRVVDSLFCTDHEFEIDKQ